MDRLLKVLRKLLSLLEGRSADISEPLPWRPWMNAFLRDLDRNQGNVSRAIELNPKSRYTIYKYRRRNEKFCRRWKAIIHKGHT